MFDEDDGDALVPEFPDHREQFLHDNGRQPEGQLVDHEQPWPGQERHGEAEHLLLAPREVAGPVVESVGQLREPFQHTTLGGLWVVPAIQPRGGPEVLGDAQGRKHPDAAR